jgi:hypothetical protein
MATLTNRTNPVRTTNNKTAAAVRKALKTTARRADAIVTGLDKVYAENECIAQTIDALQQKINDGRITAEALYNALVKIEDRVRAVNSRLSGEQLKLSTLAGDADWIADGNEA